MIVVFAAHLMCVNVASAAPIVSIWLEWRWTKHGDEAAGQVGRRLAVQALWMLAAGLVTGGLALAVVWYAYPHAYIGAARQIPTSRYAWGAAELLFSFAVWGAYCALWERWRRRRWLHRALGLVSITNLVYHFPLLFAAISVLSTRPETWVEGTLERGALVALLFDPETLARFAHFMLASLAVTGVFMMAAAWITSRPQDPNVVPKAAVWGARIALAATVTQWVVGTLLLVRLPSESQQALLGGDLVGTLLLAGGLLAMLALLHHLAVAALGGAGRRQTIAAIVLMTLTVVTMVGAKHCAELPIHRRIEAEATLVP